MHADACFFIGSTHEVCEDYALSGVTRSGLVYAALSDGCSGSTHTDFGARFLCHAAARQIEVFGDFNSDRVIWEAAGMARQANLKQTSLDATLLFAMQSPVLREVQVWIAGDGVVVARRRDGGLEAYLVSFRHGAPAYLSYKLDGARMEGYLAQTEDAVRTVQVYKIASDYDDVRADDEKIKFGMLPGTLTFPTTYYETVFLMSDGVETFQRIEDGAPKGVELMDVVRELAAIKGFKGQFVRRRAKKFLHKTCRANDWQHSDDVSVAAIYMGEP